MHYCRWAELNGYYSTILVWEKPLSIISKNRFSQNAEFIIRVYEHGTGLQKLEESQPYSRVKKHMPVKGKNKLHPTEKPISLMEELILLNSVEGSVVLDPFMGSGTTGVASINNGRVFIGAERDSTYYEVARNRLNHIDPCHLLRN